MITVLLAEDHQMVREGLRLLVNAQQDMRVVSEAGDGRMALARARETKPTVVVLDLSMPETNGLATTNSLRATVPSASIVVLTRHGEHAYVDQLLAAGARAYVLKQSPSNELLTAIRTAASGQTYVDPAIRRGDGAWNQSRRRPEAPPITERETTVLRLMSVGHSNKDIGASLGISVKTVEVHKANAMRKLKLTGRTDVVRYAAVNGWLQDP
jgi:two-component system, NarL family, response regulator NreC